MTDCPEKMLCRAQRVPRQSLTRGSVGESRPSHSAHVDRRAEWLEDQHQRDLETLDRIERQLQEHAR